MLSKDEPIKPWDYCIDAANFNTFTGNLRVETTHPNSAPALDAGFETQGCASSKPFRAA